MPRADFLTGLILVATGAYMVLEGLRLPGAGGFIEAGGEPGRVPVIVGSAILVLAGVLLVRAVGQGGHRLRSGQPPPAEQRRGLMRCLGAAVLCSVYAVGLLGAQFGSWRLPYHQATFVFLLVFIVVFEWRFAGELADSRQAVLERRAPALARAVGRLPAGAAPYLWLLAVAALQAGLTTWAVTYLFEQQFYVKLP